MFVFAIGLIIGLSWREYPWNPVLLIPIVLLIRELRRTLPLALAFAIGFAFSPDVPRVGIERAAYVDAVATIESVPRLFPDRISYLANLQGKRIVVREPLATDRSLGDRIQLKGLVRPLPEGTDSSWLSKGVVGRITPISVQLLTEGPHWLRVAARVRRLFVAYSGTVLAPSQAAMLDALCFNVDSGLDDELQDHLQRSGTIHIVSASGLHALVLASLIDWVLGIFPIPRPIRLIVLGLLLAFYAAAAGLQPAILRSVLMAMLVASAYLWRRESDLISSLSLAAILYLAWEPLGIYNLGFQFSFVTVAAFGLFGSFYDEHPTSATAIVKSSVGQALRTTNIAFWATLPLLAFHFGFLSVVAIPANIAILPAAMVLVFVGMGSFVIYGLLPGISQILANSLLSPLISFLEGTVSYFGNLSIASMPGPGFSGYWLLPVYGLMLIWARERVRPA